MLPEKPPTRICFGLSLVVLFQFPAQSIILCIPSVEMRSENQGENNNEMGKWLGKKKKKVYHIQKSQNVVRFW